MKKLLYVILLRQDKSKGITVSAGLEEMIELPEVTDLTEERLPEGPERQDLHEQFTAIVTAFDKILPPEIKEETPQEIFMKTSGAIDQGNQWV